MSKLHAVYEKLASQNHVVIMAVDRWTFLQVFRLLFFTFIILYGFFLCGVFTYNAFSFS